ncbi:pyridoxamine 5'-phosphate oxidase family protein [Paenibacillus sp. VCA1]|uniref:pyridoxamine 5'-phosphate oxidase family protein n=1 Tax=Paenibacillus sp. VCA1 TaxID=3039148 RepID=UPI00287197F5|nr:pyridoxamine 5'-phosphate oxidase family protein [Paenibacillus sp. VCA1]MDR9854202.1 pyridoxamine 5'-phosphate oxidase family protein [Paenibacillus sp. VCA1]
METIEISDDLFELLDGERLDRKQHEAMMLMTVTDDGWPHNAMISVGEIVAFDKKTLRLALWPGTNTTQNCIRSGKALLVAVYKGKVNYVRLSLTRIGMAEEAKHPLERFSAVVASFKEDVAKYADITSGIQIQLKNPDEVLTRWKETLKETKG